MKATRALLGLAALLVLGLSAMGCNTTEGFGRDLERGGEKLQDSANRHK